jgi:tripartite-type tricarboxylate transporter receptor subunit TctC
VPKFIALLVAIVWMITPGAAQAQSRLTLVVGFAPGGTSSTAARIIAESLEGITGQSVLVENRPGASGAISAETVRQQKNSRTLLFMSSTSALSIPPDSGLVPVGIVAGYSYVVVARKDAPPTFEEYVKAARSDVAFRTVGTAGAGSVAHMIGERLFERHGLNMRHIPYKGSAPAIQDVLGAHIALAVTPVPDFVGFKDEMRVVAETGRGFETDGWVAIYAPPGTSAAEVQQLSALFEEASSRSGDALERMGFKPQWRTGDELLSVHRRQYRELFPVLARLGLTP